MTLCGTAAAFSQSLGLSGGLATLTLYYDVSFSMGELFAWTSVAALFGVFLGVCFRSLVESDLYPWPVARLNAETILSFHAENNSKRKCTDDSNDDHSVEAALSVFFAFFSLTFVWYLLANQFLPFLITLPVLCWVCKTLSCQVLGEGYTGIGFPGLSLGPSIILGWNASM